MNSHDFQIWAPTADAVEVDVDGVRHPARREGERWSVHVDAAPGTRYRLVVDGFEMPDPGSRSQPDGVHGASEVVALPDRAARPAAPPGGGALDRAVIHEIHVGTFSDEGTFLGAVRHLDALVELGVTHVELMPIAAFAGRWGWGYDGVDLFAPHPSYGTPADLCVLVDEAHRRGLAVLLDVVHNHMGPDGNFLPRLGPFSTDRYRTPWGDAVNLDGSGSDGVRRFLLDSAVYWIEEIGFDGLRLDAVHELVDTSARPFLEQLSAEVAACAQRLGRDVVLIAESDRNDPRLVSPAPGGMGLDAHWSDDLHHTIHVSATGEGHGYYRDYAEADLERTLVEGYLFQGDRRSSNRGFTPGRSVRGTPSERLVVSLQNHDQVGNRARGERLHHLVGGGPAGAAAALVLLSPFTVLTFQGEQWAASSPFPYFTDHHAELGRAVTEGRRREFEGFGWGEDEVFDPQDPGTFRAAALRWDERAEEEHSTMEQWYRRLIQIRRSHSALAPAALPVAGHEAAAEDGVVVVRRGPLTTVADLRSSGPARSVGVEGAVIAAWGDAHLRGSIATMSPGSALVLER